MDHIKQWFIFLCHYCEWLMGLTLIFIMCTSSGNLTLLWPGCWRAKKLALRDMSPVTCHESRVTCHVCVTSLVSSRAVSVLYWPMFALCGGDAGSVDIQPSPWYLDIYSFLLSVDITIYSLGSYNIHNNSLITTKHKEPGWHTSGYNYETDTHLVQVDVSTWYLITINNKSWSNIVTYFPPPWQYDV